MSEKIMGGVETNAEVQENTNSWNVPVKQGFWTKFKNFWLQDIEVELTPYQQKVEDELTEFLDQEITWGKVKDLLFQEVTLTKRKAK